MSELSVIHMVRSHYASDEGSWTNDIRAFRHKPDAEAFSQYLCDVIAESYPRFMEIYAKEGFNHQSGCASDRYLKSVNTMVQKDLNLADFDLRDWGRLDFGVETYEVF